MADTVERETFSGDGGRFLMATMADRAETVKAAWDKAFARIHAELGDACPSLERLRSDCPGFADEIDAAEKAAEEASVRWMEGGPGGVQVKIDRWVSAWIAAADALAEAA